MALRACVSRQKRFTIVTASPGSRTPFRSVGRRCSSIQDRVRVATTPLRGGGQASTTRRRCRRHMRPGSTTASALAVAACRLRDPCRRRAVPARAPRGARLDSSRLTTANIYFDTASYGRRSLEFCLATFGVTRLVYGSDAPGHRRHARRSPLSTPSERPAADAICSLNRPRSSPPDPVRWISRRCSGRSRPRARGATSARRDDWDCARGMAATGPQRPRPPALRPAAPRPARRRLADLLDERAGHRLPRP